MLAAAAKKRGRHFKEVSPRTAKAARGTALWKLVEAAGMAEGRPKKLQDASKYFKVTELFYLKFD
jgi:hypothetical protein